MCLFFPVSIIMSPKECEYYHLRREGLVHWPHQPPLAERRRSHLRPEQTVRMQVRYRDAEDCRSLSSRVHSATPLDLTNFVLVR
jgi:hypothetical protein